MSFGIDRSVAEAVVRALDINYKTVAFFREVNKKSEELQKSVEEKLDRISLVDNAANPQEALKKIQLGVHDLVNTLKAVKFAMNPRKRKVLKKIISWLLIYQTISDENKSLIALKKLLQMLIIIYIKLRDDHEQFNSRLEISIMTAISKFINQTTVLYGKSLMKAVDSEHTKSRVEKIFAGQEKEESLFLGDEIEL